MKHSKQNGSTRAYQDASQLEEAQLDIKALLNTLKRNWIYYAIAVLLIAIIAFSYLKLTTPTYLISSTLLIHDNNRTPSEGDVIFQNMNLNMNSKELENEIGLLKSFHSLQETIKSLNFQVSYYKDGFFGISEKYRNFPFLVQLDTNARQLEGQPIYIKPISTEEFQVSIDSYKFSQICEFGQECNSDYFKFTVFRSFDQLPSDLSDYYIEINNLDKITEKYQNKLLITQVGTGSTLLELSITGSLPRKEINFLDRLGEVYIEQNLKEKNTIAQRTIDFINGQLSEVSDSLRGAENQLQAFRSEENVMDLSFAATSASEKLNALENEQAQVRVKLRYYNYLLKYIRTNVDVINTIVAPSSIGIADPLLNELIMELKRLYSEKVALDYTRANKSYELNVLNLQIENARKSLIENVSNIIQSTHIALQNVNNRIGEVKRVVNKLPENERDLVRIQRKFNLSDNLYNFLLQKRAEAGIAKASNRPDHKVVDHARIVGGVPIKPKKTLVYVLSVVLAFIIPTIIVLIKEFLSETVKDTNEVEKLTNIPIIGKISKQNNKMLSVAEAPQTQLAEDFRALRYNLNYFIPNQEQKVIGITSSRSSEGKTFTSFNLASMIRLSKRKTLLIEADLRKPDLKVFDHDLNYTVGLSNYLIGRVPLDQVIQKTHLPGLDIITSGPLPPNPAELLDSPKLYEMMDELRNQYDCIIVDSSPTGLVSDFNPFLPVLDVLLYVVRLDSTKANYIRDLHKDYQLGKFKNLAIIVNCVKRSGKEGYKYGYYHNGKNGKDKLKELQY